MAQTMDRPNYTWPSWLVAIVGVWVFFSPWILGFSINSTALWNSLILGVLLGIVGVWAYAAQQPQLQWVNVVFGAWLALSPWILGFAANHTALWNELIFGIVAIILAIWGATAEKSG